MRSSVRSRLAPPAGCLPQEGGQAKPNVSSMRTLIRRVRSIDRGVLSDIVKRGSYQACEREKSCARVHVFAVQLRQADILLRRIRAVSQDNCRKGVAEAGGHVAAQLSSAKPSRLAVGAILRSKAGLSVIFVFACATCRACKEK